MKKEEILYAAELMKAAAEGKEIECKGKMDCKEWKPLLNIEASLFNWGIFDYRIKSQPKYRPFNNAEEVFEAIKEHGDWIQRKEDLGYFKIVCISGDLLHYGQRSCDIMKNIFEYFTFADGTPFGKLEE